jgi:hypothetical protein
MKRLSLVLLALVGIVMTSGSSVKASTCTPTGFFRDSINMTAALINPAGIVTGIVPTGCNIGVYYDASGAGGTVKAADISGSNYFGVLINGDAGPVSVDVLNSTIHDIGESPLNGSQHGVGIYYRSFDLGGSATGKVSGNQLARYQKGGIVVNGVGSNVVVSGNTVNGQGPVSYIAQNGIQFGFGSAGSSMKNTVTGHSYTGSSTASGGIIVVGGDCYGSPLTTGIQMVQNIVRNNDVGVWLSNVNADCVTAPDDQTNIKVVNNTISSDGGNNGIPYSAGVSDQGNNDKIINNTISGVGYSSPGIAVDAEPLYTNRPKVHANN